MNYVLTDKARAVLKTLQEHLGEDLTAQEVAEMAGVEGGRSITGVLNAMARETAAHGSLIFREAVEDIEGKVIRLTEEGKATDPDAVIPEEDTDEDAE